MACQEGAASRGDPVATLARWHIMPSSAIRRFAYDASRRVLDVEFVSGRRYRYSAVPPAVAEAFREAASKGRFFNARIRDRFAFAELTADRRDDWLMD
jgi:lysyl-tRNA synthetase class 2